MQAAGLVAKGVYGLRMQFIGNKSTLWQAAFRYYQRERRWWRRGAGEMMFSLYHSDTPAPEVTQQSAGDNHI